MPQQRNYSSTYRPGRGVAGSMSDRAYYAEDEVSSKNAEKP